LNIFKQLASQTAVYGLTSIVGRLINYLLTPLLTAKFAFAPEEYGIITELYAYVTFFIIILALGLETAFFRFSSKKEVGFTQAFSASFLPVALFSLVFFTLITAKSDFWAAMLGYANNPQFLIYLAAILALDNLSAIPLASLRFQNKAGKFALINLASIFINVGFIVIAVGFGKRLQENGSTHNLIQYLYNPSIGVGYVFIANLLGSGIKFLLLLPQIIKNFVWPKISLVKNQLWYGLPLLFAGLGGMVNETIDRVLLKQILTPKIGLENAMFELGIYGANYKIAVLIALFLQAFRYAAEPFFFAKSNDANAKEIYAKVMDFLVTALIFAFLVVTLFIDVFKYFIPNQVYWQGLKVVPVLMLAKILLGIYYSQSIWYKLSGRTIYGAYIAGFGAIITIVLNLILVPKIGYMGCAWATLIAYFCMLVVSQIWGQKVYPVPYRVKYLSLLIVSAVATYLISFWINQNTSLNSLLVNAILLLIFTALFYKLQGKQLLNEIRS
jgi:O-antigen/teichoic acid export membrane protein